MTIPHEVKDGKAVPAAAAKPPTGTPSQVAWRKVKRAAWGWRQGLIDRMPPWVRRTFGPMFWHLDMLFIDHGILRLVYVNRHRLGDRAWRSGQPSPRHIRALKRQGLRTVVNLRGERQCGSYWLEERACARKGIALVNFKLRSRAPPTAEEIKAARDLFQRIEYPVLMHCKSGADRVGMMSALYRLFQEGAPVLEAKKELAFRYGHFRQADTGVLDRVFEQYLEDNARRPMPFMEWVETVYDPVALKRSFRSAGWARRLVDQVLKRE